MELVVLGSGSSGNCYLLKDDKECLIIEMGVNFDRVKEELNFDFSTVVGAVLTHEHGDHSNYLDNVISSGIEVIASKGTLDVFGRKTLCRVIKKGTSIKLGNFEVNSFDVKHDCAEPIGFVIRHPDSGDTLFLTDSYYSPLSFKGLNNIMIEANYCDDIIKASGIPKERIGRTVTSHMSIQTCCQFLSNQDMSEVNNIILIHLSDQNSNAFQFKQKATQATGKQVFIAEKGLRVNFDLSPF